MAADEARSALGHGKEPTGTVSTAIVFLIDNYRLALPLDRAVRAVRIVHVTSLPNAPSVVLGLINVEGRVVPVINLRARFQLADKDISLSDQLLIAKTSRREIALWVDAVTGVVEFSEEDFTAAATIVPGLDRIKGIIKLASDIVLVHDLDALLSLEEERSLDNVIRNV